MINIDELGLLAGAAGLLSLLQNLCVFAPACIATRKLLCCYVNRSARSVAGRTLREILRRLCVKFQPPNV